VLNYEKLSDEISMRIKNDRENGFAGNLAFNEENVIRRDSRMELSEYYPAPLDTFEEFDNQIENCYVDKKSVRKLVPGTLEGCVMRISDIIAYLGKDRQDAEKADILQTDAYEDCAIRPMMRQMYERLLSDLRLWAKTIRPFLLII